MCNLTIFKLILFISILCNFLGIGDADRRLRKGLISQYNPGYGYAGYHGQFAPYAYHHPSVYGCKRCGGIYGNGYGYNRYPVVPYHGHPIIPNSGFIGGSSSASANAGSFGGLSHANSQAQSEVATLNLGPLQATYSKSQANANSNAFGK